MACLVVVPAAARSWRFSRSSGLVGRASTPPAPGSSSPWRPWSCLPDLTDTERQRLADRLRPRLVDGVLTIVAREHRQQLRNRLATRGSQQRRIEARKQRGQLKKQRRSWD
jgi:ribosome-associated protein